MGKKLYKSRRDVKIDGVCGGIAEYLGVDSTLVRIVCVIAAFVTASVVFWLYLACVLIMPREPETRDYYEAPSRDDDNEFRN